MENPQNSDHHVRVGIFSTVAHADRAVRRLLESGFTKDQVGVLCTGTCQDRFFADMPKARVPAEAKGYGPAAATGGIVGATIGGLALAATTLVTGGAALVAAGTVLVGGGAIAGAFSGAMATMGADDRLGDYFKEALLQGKILVVVHQPADQTGDGLAAAETLMVGAGADSVLEAPE